jgi:LacI family transcriptional regulator
LRSLKNPQLSSTTGNARQVALLVETAIVSGREILKGIGRFLREGNPWSVVHEPRNLLDPAPDWIRPWKGHGIIARVSSPEMARTLQRTRLPVVDVLGLVKDTPFPLVHVDNAALARLAVEHLSSQRPASLGFYGFRGENWSEQRRDAFIQTAESLGYRPLVLEVERAARFRGASQKRLAQWLKSLPKRAGVMVCNDELASDLLQTSRREGVAVPGDLAVIGVDDDEALCSIACPALTSIRAAHAEVGYQAAKLLNQMMKGIAPKHPQILISPGDVIARQSTDPMQVADPQLQRALAFIEKQSRGKLSVDAVANAAGLSRSVLQRRFRAHFGSTVLDAIQKRKIETACRLLMETEMKPAEIAERAGFLYPEYFATVFKKTMDCTPRQYRQAVRRGCV